MAKNFKGIYNKIDEEVIKEKLKELYTEIVGTKRTSYSQCLVLWEDGTLEIHRLGQNESLQAEFKGECLTIYSEQEFDITDIEGWTEDEVEIFIDDNFYEWYENVLERIDETLEQYDEEDGEDEELTKEVMKYEGNDDILNTIVRITDIDYIA